MTKEPNKDYKKNQMGTTTKTQTNTVIGPDKSNNKDPNSDYKKGPDKDKNKNPNKDYKRTATVRTRTKTRTRTIKGQLRTRTEIRTRTIKTQGQEQRPKKGLNVKGSLYKDSNRTRKRV